MTERMTDARLAEIQKRHDDDPGSRSGWSWAELDRHDLLAEVRRLRGEIVQRNEDERLIQDYDNVVMEEIAAVENVLLTYIDRLCARLAQYEDKK